MASQATYMALLTLFENNMRVLHWNVCGKNFAKDHTRFADYYEQLGEFMDQAAEQMITVGENPVNLTAVTDILQNDEVNAFIIDPKTTYSGHAANVAAKQMFEMLYKQAVELADEDDLPMDVCDVYMDHARYYRIEGTYKLGRALIDNE